MKTIFKKNYLRFITVVVDVESNEEFVASF